MSRIAVCSKCGLEKAHKARGMCYRCYGTWLYRGGLRAEGAELPELPELPECAAPECRRQVTCEGLAVCCRHIAYQLGITYRQMDYWTHQGFLHPEGFGGSGTERKWPELETQVAQRMGILTAAGLPLTWSAQFARNDWPCGELAPGILVSVTE